MALKTEGVKQTSLTRLALTHHIQTFSLTTQNESETTKHRKQRVRALPPAVKKYAVAPADPPVTVPTAACFEVFVKA